MQIYWTPKRRFTVDLYALPDSVREWLKGKLGIKDKRPFALIIEGSSLLNELAERIRL